MRHILFGVLIDVLHEKRFVDGLSFFFFPLKIKLLNKSEFMQLFPDCTW